MALIQGTIGDDILSGTQQDDIIDLFGGYDTVNALGGNDIINASSIGEGQIDGGAGYDTVVFQGPSSVSLAYFNAAIGSMVINTTPSTPIDGYYSLVNVERVEVLNGAGAMDYLTLIGNGTNETLDVSAEAVNFQAAILGFGGDDVITTGATFTTISGGDGDDTISIGSGGSQIDGGMGADTITAGSGYDVLLYNESNAAVYIDFTGNTANTGGHAQGDVLSGTFEFVIGSEFADTFIGGNGVDDITGQSGNDIIDGGAGDDRIDGSFDSDTLTGGAGNDTFVYDFYDNAFSDTLTDLAIGDRIQMNQADINGNFTLPSFIGTAAFSGVAGEMRYEKSNGQTLIHIDTNGDLTANETLTISNGEFDLLAINVTSHVFDVVIDNSITGTSGPNMLVGTPNNDIIFGLGGDDTITTLTGNDTVDAGDGNDLIIIDEGGTGSIDGGAGFDTVRMVSDTYGFASYGELNAEVYLPSLAGQYTITNAERIEAVSTTGVLNYLTLQGNSDGNILDASTETVAFNINIFGGAGNDNIVGGSAFNVLEGNSGDDALTAGSGGSSLIGGAGADVITSGAGYDVLDYQGSLAGINIDLSGANASTGGDAQGDTFIGAFEQTLGSNFDDTITGSVADEVLYGFNGMDTIYGGDGADEINGFSDNDTLFGQAGNDMLTGGTGTDTLTGGAGDDVFQFFQYDTAFEDTITDFAVGDTVEINFGQIGGNFALPTFIGDAAFSGVIGEMRFEKTGGQTLLHIDTTGNMAADFTMTIANGEFDLTEVSNTGAAFQLATLAPVTPNLVTTVDDEFAEDTDLLTQGNDGTGLSLREAVAIANDAAGADVIAYDVNVVGQTLTTTLGGPITVSEDLTISSGVTLTHPSGTALFDVANGATLVNNAVIDVDATSDLTFPSLSSGILVSDANSTFTNTGTINTNGFGPSNNDRSTSIEVDEANATINNAAGASIISQGRYAIYSFAFDDVTNDYIPDFLTVNNDGLLEATDDTIRIGTGVINNTGTIRSLGLLDFDGFFDIPGLASDAIAIVNDLDASFVPGADGVLVVNNSATGLIEGFRSGIQMQGGGTVNNDGVITGNVSAIFTGGFDDFSNIFVLNNTGTISTGSDNYGLNSGELRGSVSVFSGLDSAVITNSGTIDSGHYGIFSTEGLTLNNTSTGQIIGDTDGTGDDEISFRGSVLEDFEVEVIAEFQSPFNLVSFVSVQGITIDGNGDLVTSFGTFAAPLGQVEVLRLTNVDAPFIMALVDLTATIYTGQIVFQTDANGTIFPPSVALGSTNNGVLEVSFTNGQATVVSNATNETVYAISTTADYGDSIDNNGLMSGDILTGLGDDAIINRGNIDGDIYLGEGNDNYTAGAAGLSGDIYAGEGSDIINARTGVQAIFGEGGNDFLRGGEGDDILHGGFGADFLRGGTGADVLNGFAGTDWADYITSSSGVTVDLLAGTGTGGEAQGDTYLFIERVYGSNHDDIITGDNGANYLRGANGDDVLNGGDGVDFLQGDAGADALDGGDGADFAYYASSTSGLTIDLGNAANNTGEAVGDTYVSIENIVGSNHNDIIYGDASNNFLRGLNGDDMLFGGDGADFLRGDAGADILDGGNGLDWAYYAASNGAVTVDLSAGTGSGGHAAGDTYVSIERLFGSVFGDTFTGDGSSNYLRGFTGNDALNGGAGTDFLQGDAGADALDGGAGTDWAYYVSARTGITADLGNSANNTGEAAGDTYISIESLRGSSFDDVLIGDGGTNFIVGGTGDDIINGGAGNDTLRGDTGADTFVFESGTFRDKVIDYDDAENDMLDFSAFGFTDVNDALSNAVDTAGGDVVFTIGTDVITIENTTILEITDNLIV